MTTIKKLKKEIKKLDRLMLLSDRDFKKYFELGEKEKTDKYDEKIVTAGSQYNIFRMRRRALQIKLSLLEQKQREVLGFFQRFTDWNNIKIEDINKIFEGE